MAPSVERISSRCAALSGPSGAAGATLETLGDGEGAGAADTKTSTGRGALPAHETMATRGSKRSART